MLQGGDYSYTTSPEPNISSPTPGSTLVGNTATFTIDKAGQDVTSWIIWIGSTPGTHDLHAEWASGTTSAITVNTIPTDGSTIHVRLFYEIGNSGSMLQGGDYSYITGI